MQVAGRMPAGYKVVVPAGVVRVAQDGRLVSGRLTDAGGVDISEPEYGFLELSRDGPAKQIGNVLTLAGEDYHDTVSLLRPWARLGRLPAREVREALWHARDPRPREGHQIAPDIFGRYQRRPAPRFLLSLAYRGVAAEPEVVPGFLRKMSLTRPAPTAEEVRDLVREPGMISRGRYAGRLWAPNRTRGELPDVLTAPNVRHSIWLGGPLTDRQGRANLAGAARALGDKGQVVLWTDVSRQEVEQAELHPDTPRLAAIADFVGCARDHRVLVVDVFEVLHRDAPMINAEALLAEADLRRR